MSRVWILGARGRLGAALARLWGATREVRTYSRAELDVSDPQALEAFLTRGGYDLLVNCAGMTSLEACEEDPAMAGRVNGEAPGHMARMASAQGARLIHFSTDYVFDGLTPGLRAEGDPPHPLSEYGRTKRDGERAVRADSDRHLVVRVSWVFGPDKPSFVDWILKQAIQKERVEAVSDKFSAPTYTHDVAQWLEPWLEGDLPGGIWHACNSGSCSWQEYGQAALDTAADCGWPLRARTVDAVALADMKIFRAIRPVHTTLSNKKLATATGRSPRPWREALGEYISELPVPAI